MASVTREQRRLENRLVEKYKKRSCQWHKLLTCYPLNNKQRKTTKNPFEEKKKNRKREKGKKKKRET